MADAPANKKGEKDRGTQNELEIISIIVSENRGLLNRVLDKIRASKAESKKTYFAKEKKAASET